MTTTAQELKPLHVHVSSNVGQYYITSNEKQCCITVRTNRGLAVSELWPVDKAPDVDGVPPSEVIDLIAARSKSYWISTGREKTLAEIEKMKEISAEMDSAWAKDHIARLDREIKSYRQYIIEDEEPK